MTIEIDSNMVSAGNGHNLIVIDGNVRAQGDNSNGQLGYGSQVNSNKYVDVKNLTDVRSVKAKDNMSYAITNDNDLYAWGENNYGQLGDGTTTDKLNPEFIMSDVVQVDAGESHTIALKSDGSVWAWGCGDYGKLGLGGFDTYKNPVCVSNLDNIVKIAAGLNSSYALKNDGTLYVWGLNDKGQLSFDGSDYINVPTPAMYGISQFAAGDSHVIAMTRERGVYTWGLNNHGQSGINDLEYTSKLYRYTYLYDTVSDPKKIKLYAGADISAYTENNQLYQWGGLASGDCTEAQYFHIPDYITELSIGKTCMAINDYSDIYRLGLSVNNNIEIIGNIVDLPANIQSKRSFVSVCANETQTAALCKSGDVMSWGTGSFPDKDNATQPYMKKIEGLKDVVKICNGDNHFAALDKNGNVYGWGADAGMKQNVIYDIAENQAVYTLSGDGQCADIAVGKNFCVLLKKDGTVWTKGHNGYGQVSGSGNRTSFGQVAGLDGINIKSVYAGDYYAMALAQDGTLYAWGRNNKGQLGLGDYADRSYPTEVPNAKFKIVKSGINFVLALGMDRELYSWGANGSSQLGHNHKNNVCQPEKVEGFKNKISTLGTGYNHSMLILNDGSLWTAGYGTEGQLGHGELRSSWVFKKVEALTNIADVSGGRGFTVAIDKNGAAWRFGKNDDNQLGIFSDNLIIVTADDVEIISPADGEQISSDGNVLLKWNNAVYDADIKVNGYLIAENVCGTSANINIPYDGGSQIELITNCADTAAVMINKEETPRLYNIAFNVIPTASCKIEDDVRVTDGIKQCSGYYWAALQQGNQWIQFDFENEFPIEAINVWRLKTQYHDVIIQLSNDPDFNEGVVTIYNNDVDNSSGQGAGIDEEFYETDEGHCITLDNPIPARYVRLWSGGSVHGYVSNYREIEVLSREQNKEDLTTYHGVNFNLKLQKSLIEISSFELNKLIANLDKAYDSYAELVGYKPYDGKKIHFVSNNYENYYALAGYDISLNAKNIRDDLINFAVDNTVGFGWLHEIGHNFTLACWNFDTEHFANFQMLYVLAKNPGILYKLTLDELVTGTYYKKYLETIGRPKNGGDDSGYGYHNDAATYCCSRVADAIGWEPFEETFRYFVKFHKDEESSGRGERFKLFFEKLQEYYNPGGTEAVDTFVVNPVKRPPNEFDYLSAYYTSITLAANDWPYIYELTNETVIELCRETGLDSTEVIERCIMGNEYDEDAECMGFRVSDYKSVQGR